jgi:hypothetical protein
MNGAAARSKRPYVPCSEQPETNRRSLRAAAVPVQGRDHGQRLSRILITWLIAFVPAAAASEAQVSTDLVTELRAFAEREPEAAAAIGTRIRLNETGGRESWLITWLPGERHLSLGIGHFIWYPEGREGPFRESFQDVLEFLRARNHPLPPWLTPGSPCPWEDRESFVAADHDPRLDDLRAFIETTIGAQTRFLIERLARSIPDLLAAVSDNERPRMAARLERLLRPEGIIDRNGVYALVDYVNFKGEGLDSRERYQGEAWGLLQVLQDMAEAEGVGRLLEFSESAARVLARRVVLSPPERHEARWLPGWRVRVATYAHGLSP